MALGALGRVRHRKTLRIRGNRSAVDVGTRTFRPDFSRMEVELVTLQAQERLILYQEVVSHGTVRIVADGTIFYHRLMFKHKRSLFGGMTLEAKIV